MRFPRGDLWKPLKSREKLELVAGCPVAAAAWLHYDTSWCWCWPGGVGGVGRCVFFVPVSVDFGIL